MVNCIDSVYLENFQSHQRTKVHLAPAGQLTVFVGPTDSGKSALIRGLQWALYNVPQGIDFIRLGTSAAAVAITYTDGTMVVRERSRTGYNRYRVTRPGQADQPFEGFGTGVPREIQEITGVRPVAIGDLELNLNLAEQLDGPFLGSSISAPARARVLGQLAGTEEVDHAGRTLGTDLYRAGQDDKRLAAELEDLTRRIKEYDWLPAMAERIAILEAIVTRIKAAEDRLQRLVAAWTKLDRLRRGIAELEAGLERWRGVEKAAKAAAGAEAALDRMCRLESTRVRLANNATSRREAQTALERWRGLDEAGELVRRAEASMARGRELTGLRKRWVPMRESALVAAAEAARWAGLGEAEKVVGRCREVADRHLDLVSLRARLAMTGSQLIAEEQRHRDRAGAVQDAEQQYREILTRAGVCPWCGARVEEMRLEEAV